MGNEILTLKIECMKAHAPLFDGIITEAQSTIVSIERLENNDKIKYRIEFINIDSGYRFGFHIGSIVGQGMLKLLEEESKIFGSGE